MLHERLEGYLRSRGLQGADIPKVMGTFVTVKYATWMAFVVAGARYQPLSRFFQKPSRAAWNRVGVGLRERITSSRFAEWYRDKSKKLADRFAASTVWSATSRALALDPRRFALGMAEGVILYKLTFPLHGPLELFLVVRYYRRKHLDTEGMPSGEELSALRDLTNELETLELEFPDQDGRFFFR